VPLANSDFIVAAVGEELGLTGLMALLVLYGIVVERGLRTAIAARDAFRQAARGRAGVQPGPAGVRGRRRRHPAAALTGLTTPFLSYGGSSLVATLGAGRACCCGCPTPRAGPRRPRSHRRHRRAAPRPRSCGGDEAMNRPLRKVATAVLVMFVALLANVTYLQVFDAPSLRTATGNSRVLLEEYSHQRGPIIVAGQPVASSTATDDRLQYLRRYAAGPLYAHATGYYSFIYGSTAIERSENTILAGSDDKLFVRRVLDLLTGREQQGGSITLTLNPRAQKAAADGSATDAVRWWRSTRRPGRSSRWSAPVL